MMPIWGVQDSKRLLAVVFAGMAISNMGQAVIKEGE